ncbi:glycoside hydrolase [Sphingomonas sp. GM_Shp_1]|uniref:glycoside hydrolase n=1 Tax=Sphingomonas sp. GM_Shp_1 TaxID=2937381 RepID=UPI00226B3435|nr:glycoside hydrolase [Sphingomonas sp. GM_Shp_1]
MKNARLRRVGRAAMASFALLCGATVASNAAAQAKPVADRPVPVTLRPAIDRPSTVFEGWGTALAWFAHVTGGWPEAERTRLADLFYGPDGLGWTIARYNIGGGNAADTPPYMKVGRAVPGFWRQPAGATGKDWWRAENPAMWDWAQDANQRWWLDAITARVKQPIFEAFSNSPPWFMTVSGRVSGAEKGTDDNLRPGQEQAFATYLVRVTDELQRRHRLRFRTLSPVNEPNTDYWFAANTQEGAHWSPARQAQMIDATAAALKAKGLSTVIAAPDETASNLFVEDWAAYPAATRAAIGQLNVHSYGTVHQTAVRDIARASGIRLWMSENDTPLSRDPEDFTGMATPLAFAEHVIGDLKRLEPAAWVFWQAVEDLSTRKGEKGSNWGIIKADLMGAPERPHAIHVTGKYWAMAQFSRYIRPGDRLVPVDDMDTVGALSPDGRRLVLVHVNPGLSPRPLSVAVPGEWTREMIVTDASHKAVPVRGEVAPPRSIVTLILTR